MSPIRRIELRPETREAPFATGSLVCPDCDAPIALSERAGPATQLHCPFCHTSGPLRDFLSLRQPTRPARVALYLKVRQP